MRDSYIVSLTKEEVESTIRDLNAEEELLRSLKDQWDIIERTFIFSSEKKHHKSFIEILKRGREYYESLVAFSECREAEKDLASQDIILKTILAVSILA